MNKYKHLLIIERILISVVAVLCLIALITLIIEAGSGEEIKNFWMILTLFTSALGVDIVGGYAACDHLKKKCEELP